MSTLSTVTEEVHEAFTPLRSWLRLTPIERTHDHHAAVLDTLTTLCWWGWEIHVSRPAGRWDIIARQVVGGKTVRARVIGVDYYDALRMLDEDLTASLASKQTRPRSSRKEQ